MVSDIWFYATIASSACFFASLIWHVRRSKTFYNARVFLEKAKQETREISQLPLHNPHPMIQVSEKGEVLFANPEAIRAFPEIYDKGLNHDVLAHLKSQFSAQSPAAGAVDINYAERSYHQTVIPCQVKGQGAFIVYCYDITERKDYEIQLQQSKSIAEQAKSAADKANQARGDFLASMSHELRTPMNGIIGLTDILREADMPADQKELIDAVNASSRNLLILLNDLLDFSKIEAGELSIEQVSFDLHETVLQIKQLQWASAQKKNIGLDINIAPNVPRTVSGDPSRLQQILNNLIGNAIKFTHKGSVSIFINCEDQNDTSCMINIKIKDTGIGIAQDKLECIFMKFKQAESSTAREYGGTGLGLAITKELVELMNGDIKVKSAPGAGTEFIIDIPFAKSKNAHAKINGTVDFQRAPSINTQSKLLLVDDHPINLLFLRKSLLSLGFQNFDEAGNGQHALELSIAKAYDLIMMDCQMPDMDGYETAKKIRTQNSNARQPIIIAVTADAMQGAEEKCIEAGMDDYISKPVEREKLIRILEKWTPLSSLPNLSSEKPGSPARENTQDQIFDWGRLSEFTEGETELEEQILEIFIKNLDHDINALEHNYNSENHQEWDDLAHKIYGACIHVGANSMARACDQAQIVPCQNSDKWQALHDQIIHEYQNLQSVLKKRAAI